jgi:hypothetical protein
LAEKFQQVYTIEIDERLYKMATNKFASKNKENINCLLGDSREVLMSLVPKLCADGKTDKVVFWLDAHWAGDDTVDWENSKWKGYGRNTGYTGKGEGEGEGEGESNAAPSSRQQVPLEEEIMCIFESFENECIVYIDDYDQIDPETNKGMGDGKFKGQDWSHLDFNTILKSIESRTIEVKSLGGKQLLIKLGPKSSSTSSSSPSSSSTSIFASTDAEATAIPAQGKAEVEAEIEAGAGAGAGAGAEAEFTINRQ